MAKMYMVRAGQRNYLFDEFKKDNIIAIGWNALGDLAKLQSTEVLKSQLAECYPEYSQSTINMNAGQINRFAHVIKVGDYVVTYNSDERIYLIGKVVSGYIFNTAHEFNHIRDVEWIGNVHRDILLTSTKNSLGSIATLFEISGDAKDELLRALKKPEPSVKVFDEIVDDTNALDIIKGDFEAKANEFIKDRIQSLNWEQMQELVAALIRSLGFRTRISPQGPDRGKDIIASPDGLGLEEPRIIVEIKHRQGQMGAPQIRSFIGGLRTGDKGIYVSTGGFSKEARYEAERANFPITLIDGDYLVDLIITNYDSFDMDGRSLIPLRKVYWPI